MWRAFPLLKKDRLIDFIAAGADGRTQSDQEVSGVATKFDLHPFQDLSRDLGGRSLPSRMNGGNHLLCPVDDEDGETISGLDAQESVGGMGDHGIIFQTGRKAVSRFSQDENSVLDEFGEGESGGAVRNRRRSSKAFILGDVFL